MFSVATRFILVMLLYNIRSIVEGSNNLSNNDMKTQFDQVKSKLFNDFNWFKDSITGNIQTSSRSTNKYKRLIDVHDGPIPKNERKFVINGWRWHTISVLYDLDRYLNIVKKVIDISDEVVTNPLKSYSEYERYISQIHPCYDFVMKFNLHGLHKVEKEIFTPFLEKLLPKSIQPLLVDMSKRQEYVKLCTMNIHTLCKSLQYISNNNVSLISSKEKVILIKNNKKILTSIDELIKNIRNNIIETKSVQDEIIIPYIASHISISKQEVFNKSVISKLGLIDSQIFLVSMLEGIKDYPEEIVLYHSQIPSIALKLLPFWRKRLYIPMTQCLQW